MAFVNQIADRLTRRQFDESLLGEFDHSANGVASIEIVVDDLRQFRESGSEDLVDRFELAARQLLLYDSFLLGL